MKKTQPKRKQTATTSQACKRSICPIACTLDLLGDKWTLLVIRDLFMGKSTYSEFQTSPEGIPSNILANRLKRLQLDGIISKQAYQQHPPRYQYQLSDKGRALLPVLKALTQWGNEYIPGTLKITGDSDIKSEMESTNNNRD